MTERRERDWTALEDAIVRVTPRWTRGLAARLHRTPEALRTRRYRLRTRAVPLLPGPPRPRGRARAGIVITHDLRRDPAGRFLERDPATVVNPALSDRERGRLRRRVEARAERQRLRDAIAWW